MSTIHNLPNAGTNYKDDDRMPVDVETSPGSRVWVTDYITKKNLFEFQGMVIKKEIASASVLTLNTTPIQLVPSPGVGKFAIVKECVCKLSYGGIAYATNTNLAVRVQSMTDFLFRTVGILSVTADTFINLKKQDELTTGAQYIENRQIEAYVETGDPTLGNSDVILYYQYFILDI